MYDHDYGPKFLTQPDRVEAFKHDGEFYDLEVRTHISSYEDDAELTVMFRLCDPHQHRSALAIGTYVIAEGRVQWHRYEDDPSFSREGFHQEFLADAMQIAGDMALETLAPVCDDAIVSLPAAQTD
jgi:hypothetical protein